MKKPHCRCSTGFYIRLSLSQVLVGKVNRWKKFQVINLNLETTRTKFVNVFRGVVKTQSCLKTIFIFEVTSDFWNQECLIWVFWAVILKNHCQIWNQSPRVYVIANFYAKFKILLFRTKIPYLGNFWLELRKKQTIFMYETTTLESIHLLNFAKKQECQNLRPKIPWLGTFKL